MILLRIYQFQHIYFNLRRIQKYVQGEQQQQQNTHKRSNSLKGNKSKRAGKHVQNKKSFMSTAPLSAFFGRQALPIVNLGPKPKLKIKESKAELKQYSHKLEEALAKVKQQLIELEKDHEILNKTYMRELKKGDRMHQALQKVKSLVSTIIQKRLCIQCIVVQEMADLQKVTKERIFDASNEADTTLDQVDISFKPQTRGQANPTTIVRTRAGQSHKSQVVQPPQTKEQNFQQAANLTMGRHVSNKLSSIISEVEMEAGRSPMTFLHHGMESNKISAIGIPDYAPKESPFWDNDNIFELQQNFLNGGEVLETIPEKGRDLGTLPDDEFLR